MAHCTPAPWATASKREASACSTSCARVCSCALALRHGGSIMDIPFSPMNTATLVKMQVIADFHRPVIVATPPALTEVTVDV